MSNVHCSIYHQICVTFSPILKFQQNIKIITIVAKIIVSSFSFFKLAVKISGQICTENASESILGKDSSSFLNNDFCLPRNLPYWSCRHLKITSGGKSMQLIWYWKFKGIEGNRWCSCCYMPRNSDMCPHSCLYYSSTFCHSFSLILKGDLNPKPSENIMAWLSNSIFERNLTLNFWGFNYFRDSTILLLRLQVFGFWWLSYVFYFSSFGFWWLSYFTFQALTILLLRIQLFWDCFTDEFTQCVLLVSLLTILRLPWSPFEFVRGKVAVISYY